jgi:hypothetical protein
LIITIQRDFESGLVFLKIGAHVDSLRTTVVFTAGEAVEFLDALKTVIEATSIEKNENDSIEREIQIV